MLTVCDRKVQGSHYGQTLTSLALGNFTGVSQSVSRNGECNEWAMGNAMYDSCEFSASQG